MATKKTTKKAGAHSQQAVIYCRVSSIKQATVGDGLRSQETRCRDYPTRPRHLHLGLQTILRWSMLGSASPPRSATSATESATPKASLSHHARQTWPPHRRFKLVPQPAKSRKTHSAQPVARGFGLPGLSGAYRQPKLFREPDRQLTNGQTGKLPIAHA